MKKRRNDMKRIELVKEMLKELSYPGNLGAMEIFKFYDVANPKEIKVLDRLMKQKKWKEAWRLIQKTTKVNLFGKEFEATIKTGETEAGKEKMKPKPHWEVSPPGWKGTVKAMKKHKDITNPWALAWWMKDQGDKPHYRDKAPYKKKK